MKKKLLCILVSLAFSLVASADVTIDETNFPDENFRSFLKRMPYGEDGVITEEEIKSITNIDIAYYGVTNVASLEGIEHFTSLERLNCYGNKLTSLDVSHNPLTYLDCRSNQLTSLDVSTIRLCYLYCSMNQLTNLVLSSQLWIIECDNNQLTTLDLSNNTVLVRLRCESNQMVSLDISKCKDLELLNCGSNPLTNLDISNNKKLKLLTISNSHLTDFDISTNPDLEGFSCENMQWSNLDVSKNTKLKSLQCSNNLLTSLDVSKNAALEYLYCNDNQLTSLDVSNNTALIGLECSKNKLTSLYVTNATALSTLWCYRNQIKDEFMDAFVGSLPIRDKAYLMIIDNIFETFEGNVCTKDQVNIAREKGWIVQDALRNNYEGSDPSAIKGVFLDKDLNIPIYDLNGVRVNEVRKGINVIGGKKVVIR